MLNFVAPQLTAMGFNYDRSFIKRSLRPHIYCRVIFMNNCLFQFQIGSDLVHFRGLHVLDFSFRKLNCRICTIL